MNYKLCILYIFKRYLIFQPEVTSQKSLNRLTDTIKQANESIYIAVFRMTSPEIIRSLIKAAELSVPKGKQIDVRFSNSFFKRHFHL